MKEIELKLIVTEADLQVRVSTNQEHLDDLTEAFGDDEKRKAIPPVDVFQTFAGGFLLADGFHRVESATKAKRKTIACNVHKGERADALKFALAANHAHGLRRTIADKQRAVLLALKEWPGESSRVIATMCGVSNSTVVSHRPEKKLPPPKSQPCESHTSTEEAKPTPEPEPAPKVKGKDGKSYPATPPKKKKAAASPDLLDRVGRLIPEDLIVSWKRAEELFTMVDGIRGLKNIFNSSVESDPLLFKEVHIQDVGLNLDKAHLDAARVKPHALCATCNGTPARAKCTGCKGRGFVSKFYWDTCVTEEIKAILTPSKPTT